MWHDIAGQVPNSRRPGSAKVIRNMTYQKYRVESLTQCRQTRAHIVDKGLNEWCHTQRIEFQIPMPYSPPQKQCCRANELHIGRTSRRNPLASITPQILVGARRRTCGTYTKPGTKTTPYQISLAWQKIEYITYTDSAHPSRYSSGDRESRGRYCQSHKDKLMSTTTKGSSVKYYNGATTTMLTSKNLCFLSPMETTPLEGISIEPDPLLEGEHSPLLEGEHGPPLEGEHGPPLEGEHGPPLEGEHSPPLEGEHGPPYEGERGNGTHCTTLEKKLENSKKREAGMNIDTREPWRIRVLQSTDQFFLFPLLWTTQYIAHSTAPPAYKYNTCTRTSCPAHIVLTACPTCIQPIPY